MPARVWPLRLECGCIIEAVGWFYAICQQHKDEIDAAVTDEQEWAIATRLAEQGR